MKKKLLVIGIILLFIGVAIAPSINSIVVKASDDNNLVEVTSQACGTQGFGNTTVSLTEEQYQNLEWYLVAFRAKLNQTITREEAVPLYKEAVMELSTYGLLPKGMSIAQAQKLVAGNEPSEKTQVLLKTILDRNQRGNPNNTFCLLMGNVDRADCWSLTTLASGATFLFLIFLFFFLDNHFGLAPVNLFAFLTAAAMALFLYGLWAKPINLLSHIDFTPSATGSIHYIGLSGVYNVNGTFYGDIVGFTGIRIMRLLHFNPPPVHQSPGAFFIGSAISVSIHIKH